MGQVGQVGHSIFTALSCWISTYWFEPMVLEYLLIALDKMFIAKYFSYLCTKIYIAKMLLMSTHNIYFHAEIRKNIHSFQLKKYPFILVEKISIHFSWKKYSFILVVNSSISLLPFSGRRHKMTHKGWRLVKPQLSQSVVLYWAMPVPALLPAYVFGILYTVFDLITTHAPIMAQSSNSSDYSRCTFCLLPYKGICYGYPFELHQLVDAVQMNTNTICFYKENQEEKKNTQKHCISIIT